jgi:hypothetical protein
MEQHGTNNKQVVAEEVQSSAAQSSSPSVSEEYQTDAEVIEEAFGTMEDEDGEILDFQEFRSAPDSELANAWEEWAVSRENIDQSTPSKGHTLADLELVKMWAKFVSDQTTPPIDTARPAYLQWEANTKQRFWDKMTGHANPIPESMSKLLDIHPHTIKCHLGLAKLSESGTAQDMLTSVIMDSRHDKELQSQVPHLRDENSRDAFALMEATSEILRLVPILAGNNHHLLARVRNNINAMGSDGETLVDYDQLGGVDTPRLGSRASMVIEAIHNFIDLYLGNVPPTAADCDESGDETIKANYLKAQSDAVLAEIGPEVLQQIETD